jgi:hypothetical protein
MIFVTIIEPRNREIYVNGDYDDPRGPSPTLITLNAGSHIFQTLTPGPGRRLVDFEGSVDDLDDWESKTINLSPVDPPKPKDT